jgi:hypothetical protein
MRNLAKPTLLAAALAAGVLAGPAAAQREGYTFLSYVGSEVSLASNGADVEAARVNMPILPGDRLTTGGASRAEAVLASGNVVRVDGKSDLRFERMARTYESDDDRDLLVLERGAVAVDVRDAEPRDLAFRLDTADATVLAPGRAGFRVDTGRRGTEIYAASGEIEILAQAGSVLLRAGEYAFVSGAEEIDVEAADLPRDRFTRFLEDRKMRIESAPTAGNVVSDYEYEADVASFDDYGSWVYVASVGRNGWRPTVASDWRPYSAGTWRWTPAGLTWVSYEPWGWLPYHYGSWTFDGSFGWCWLPGAAYSPAWVYWSYTPGYIGWCPVGYYGYYDNYYRSTRLWWGLDSGGVHAPHLRGRVDVSQVDPRGWNYVAAGRIGSRLDPSRDVIRGERVPFRPGETAFIATNPLRIDRGASPAPVAVQQAVRRMTDAASPRAGAPAPSEGLAAVLRRDARLSPAAEQELRRSTGLRTREDTFRPVTPDRLVTSARTDEAPVRSGVRTGTPYISRDDGWRSPSSPAPRVVERTPERPVRVDSGWRAPRRLDQSRTGDAATPRSRSDWREAAPSRISPRNDAPAVSRERVAPREAPAARDAPSHRYVPSSPSGPPAPRAAPPSAPPPQHVAPAPAPQAAPAGPRGGRQRS